MTDPAGPTPLEIINPHHLRGPFRCAVFDFDGTLSLLRGNWQGLMVPPMVEILAATNSGESHAALTELDGPMELIAHLVETRAEAQGRFDAGVVDRHAARNEIVDARREERFQLFVDVGVQLGAAASRKT